MKPDNDDRLYWFGWMIEKAPLLLLAVLLVCAGGFILFAVHFNRRLDDIQNRIDDPLRYQPPTASTVDADEPLALDASAQRTTYVPAHSHVYYGDGRATPLTITLSIRNPNASASIVVSSVDYLNTQGERVTEYVKSAIRVKPRETIEYLVGESDVTGGSGASFIVRWAAPAGANSPIIEAVMIGTRDDLGISFVQRGQELLPATATNGS